MERMGNVRDTAIKVAGQDQVQKKPETPEIPETTQLSNVLEKAQTSKTPRRRLVPNLSAIEKFLKKDLGKEFAGGLKERDKKTAMNATAPAPVSLDAAFQAMLLADVKARVGKQKIDA